MAHGEGAGHGTTGAGGSRTARGLARAYRRARFELKSVLGRFPRLYLPLARRRARGEPVRADTRFVIEGFPRSANTFATAAFGLALSTAPPPQPPVAHHLHVPAHVIAAARHGIPALVLIRWPEDAVLSLVIQQPHLSVPQALRAYVRFYRALLRHRDRFVLATFDEVTDDFGAVTMKVNRRFGTSFPVFENTEANVRLAVGIIEEENRARWGSGRQVELKGAFPSAERTALKERLRKEYARAGRLRHRAERLYRIFTLDAGDATPTTAHRDQTPA